MACTLYGLKVSAWTERARWALEHHGIRYTYHEHLPLLGEPLLRRKAKVKGTATVPLLEDGGIVVMGSLEIAKYAEKIGRGAPLFPRDMDAQVSAWFDVAERMADVGRAWFTRAMLASREAQAEALPSFTPDALRGLLSPSAKMVLRFLMKKHHIPLDVEQEVERVLRPSLDEVRAALAKSGSAGKSVAYLLGDAFTFADIAVATTLRVVRPHKADDFGPHIREAWTNEAVARDYADLLEWRDRIFEKHR